jgi:hypothetical protein
VTISSSKTAILNFIFSLGFSARVTVLATVALVASPLLPAQTVGTGSIVGIVTDAQGKPIAGAKVGIANPAVAAAIQVTTASSGLYSSGPIQAGDCTVGVEAKGFITTQFPAPVQVGNTTRVDVKMLAAPDPKAALPGSTAVNVEQATAQGVLNGEQVEKLPINGRNVFDLAQLEPGVQIQDGGVLDPGKNGINAVSILSRFGRTTSVSVDGLDIGDEMVGGNTQNIPASAIREFQVSQSSLDLSTGLTSSGAVNLITRSGSNDVHADLFGLFRGDQGAASLPGTSNTSFQREQFGGNAGGAIIKDRVFWFAEAERTSQDYTGAEPFVFPFQAQDATLSQPYREFNTDERVDWNMRGSTRAFYRLNFFQDNDLRPFSSASSFQRLRNDDNTLTNALGFDFSTGVYAHSLRFEYLKLRSHVGDATSGLNGVENPIPGLGINIGAGVGGNCALSNGGSYCAGPSWFGPQQTVQSDALAKYDGSRVWGAHIIRYGATFNHINGARLAAFAASPQVGTTFLGTSISPDPTSYAADYVSLGNGIGTTTSRSAFGFPAGGVNPDNRLEMYVGDAWKYRPNVTLTFGLNYVHDTGRTDDNLGALPALDQWGAGYGTKIRNPNLNLAPQFGFAWDAGGNGSTVIRGGVGLFYDNTLWSNTLFDNPARAAKGIFADAPQVCSGGVAAPFAWPTSLAGVTSLAGGAATVVNTSTGAEAQPTFCGGTIATVAPQILALSGAYQAATASVARQQPNGAFVGTALTALNPNYDLLYPGYRTPRSWQMNLGIQREIRPGTVLSVDIVRNIGEHFLIGQDINHTGAARSFNQANATAARDAAQVANGCSTGSGQVTCMIGRLGQAGAQAAYSAAGLDSNLQTTGGAPCSFCAFPGTNPVTGNTGAVGGVDMLFPEGRSTYNGAEIKLVSRIDKPLRGVKAANFQLGYTYSKFTSQVQDQNVINLATDNVNPTRFSGPNALDRKHQISFGGTFDLRFHTKLSATGHFYSPLAQTLQLPELTNGGEIFATDWLGAGLGAAGAPEPVPGTQIGQFGNSTNIDNLQSVLNNYNHRYANQLTPAGDCLVTGNTPPQINNLFACPGQISGPAVMTPGDMAALGWVMPTLGSVAPHAAGTPWLKSMDLKASWPIKVKERVTIEPSASVYNLFNFWNAFLPGNMASSSLAPASFGPYLAPNVLGGVAPGSSLTPFRASFQSGTFALGAPRQFEFGVRITF